MAVVAAGGKYLCFTLSGQGYAMSIDCVKEILDSVSAISPVPEFPDCARGIINLRGDIVPIIDMRRRLHMPSSGDGCIIVTESVSSPLPYTGFIVDAVSFVADFDSADICAAPRLSDSAAGYLVGIYRAGGGITMIVDPAYMVTVEMKQAIEAYAAGGK